MSESRAAESPSTRTLRVEDLYALALPEQPALSPDGTRVAYVLRTPDRKSDSNHRTLWLATADGADARPLTSGEHDSAPAWSPDGTHVAFLRQVGDNPQVWLLTVATGDLRQLTSLPLGAGAPVWSPDGRQLAFTAGVDRAATSGNQDVDAHRPLVTDRLDYLADGAGLRGTVRRHVHLLELTAAGADLEEPRRLTDGDWDASTPCWSPVGDQLAFSAAVTDEADLSGELAVHVVATVAGAVPRRVGPAAGHVQVRCWPTRTSLLGTGRIDDHEGHSSLWRIDLDTHRWTDLGRSLDRNVMPGSTAYPGGSPQVVDDGRTVLFCIRDAGRSHLYSVPLAGGTPAPVLTGTGRTVHGLSVADPTSGTGVAAVVLSTPSSFAEVVVIDLADGTERVATAHGAALAGVTLRRHVEREFTISDGTRVHGWVLRDPDVTGPTPLLLDIHGGPHNAWSDTADPVHLYHQVLAAEGWTVLLLNPRASDGYGEEHYTAGLGAWGEADLIDFTEPLDQLVAEGLADPDRLAVTGYSYGGFMTCVLTARDSRFAAAVAGGPVTDLVSMCGTSDEAHYIARHQIRGTWWSEPGRFVELSPLRDVAEVTAPTLLLHGGDDLRCPLGQSQQWFTALRERGVPARLVVYPGASHGFVFTGRPSHRIDLNQRIIDWVQEHT